MAFIQQIIGFVQAHWADIAKMIAEIIGVASIIVKLTPTLKDDTVLLKIIKVIGKYIALNRSGDDEKRAGK